MREHSWVFLTLTVLTACGPDPAPPTQRAEVFDSAGVEVVQVSFDGSNTVPVPLPLEPIARTGWQDGGPLLDVASLGGILSDGTIVVADVGSDEVLLFDVGLENYRTFGGSGEGPGEFQRVSGVAEFSADSVAVWDGLQRRATVFNIDDLGFRTVSHNPDGGVEHTIAAASGNELLWIPASVYARSFEMTQWLEIPVLRSDAALERFDSVASLPYVEVTVSGGTQVASPLSRSASFAAGPSGFAWIRADIPALESFEPTSGRLTRIVRWAEAAEPITDQRWSEWADAHAAQFRGIPVGVIRESLEEQRAGAAPTFPLFEGLEVASDGSIWIRRWRMPGSAESRYVVVSADGRCVMQVDAPDRFLFLDARDDVVLGRDVNELGVHAIALYERPQCPTVELAFLGSSLVPMGF